MDNFVIGTIQENIKFLSNDLQIINSNMPKRIDDLSDVNITSTPADGEVLTYNLSTEKFEPQAAPASSLTASFRATSSDENSYTFSSGTPLFSAQLNNASGYRGCFNIGGAYNTSTGLFTAPETGVYFFNGSISWLTSDFNAGNCTLLITKPTLNTISSSLLHSRYGANETFNSNFTQEAAGLVSLTAGDEIGLYVSASNASGAAISLIMSYFCGHRV